MASSKAEGTTNEGVHQWHIRTTCHGICDMFLAKTKLEKGFWFICLVLSFCFFCPSFLYMITTYTHQNEWISTTYEEEVDEAYLPKIVLCNYNRLNLTKAYTKYHLNATNLLYINRQFFPTAPVFKKTALGNLTRESEKNQYTAWKSGPYGNNITFEELLNDLAATCESTIHFLVYNDMVIEKPCEFVKQVSSVFFGRCLLLEVPERFGPITVPGQLEGLKMILSTNLKDYETGFVSRFLHHGLAMYMFYDAHPDYWISLTPGLHHIISIKTEKHSTNTDSFTYFKHFQNKKKRCLEDKQFLVKDKSKNVKFSKMACHIDCSLYAIATHCKCVPIFSTINYPTCEPDYMDNCLTRLATSLNVTFDKVIKVASSTCVNTCERHCFGKHVKYELSTSYLLAETKIPDIQEWLHTDGKNKSNSDLQDLIGVDIFYESLSIFTVEWREHMPVEQLISNIGGLLGLCAGISLLTIVQALFYLCVGIKNIVTHKGRSIKVEDHGNKKNKDSKNDIDANVQENE